METTANSLQEIINKRAEKKAKDFVENLLKQINQSGIFKGIEKKFEVIGKDGYNETIENCFMQIDSRYEGSPVYILYKKKLKEFTESETKDFVSKVESLVEQTDNLLNIANNY